MSKKIILYCSLFLIFLVTFISIFRVDNYVTLNYSFNLIKKETVYYQLKIYSKDLNWNRIQNIKIKYDDQDFIYYKNDFIIDVESEFYLLSDDIKIQDPNLEYIYGNYGKINSLEYIWKKTIEIF